MLYILCPSHYTSSTLHHNVLYHPITSAALMIIDRIRGDDGDQGPELRPQQPHQGDPISGTVRCTELYNIVCSI